MSGTVAHGMHPYRACDELPSLIEPDTRERDLRVRVLLGVLLGVVLAWVIPIWIGIVVMLVSGHVVAPAPFVPMPGPAAIHDDFHVLGRSEPLTLM